jgi:hypothetical protein
VQKDPAFRAFADSHIGLGFSPEVFEIIAQRLAAHER